MILKLSFKKLLKPLLRLSIVVIILLTVWFTYAGGYDSALLPGLIIILCIPVLPTIYLFAEYWIATKNQTIKITDSHLLITYKNGNSNNYSFNDLEIVKLYKSAGMEKGNFPFQTAEMYYHAEVFTKDGAKIILTSVLGPDFDAGLALLKGVNTEVKRRMYSTLYF